MLKPGINGKWSRLAASDRSGHDTRSHHEATQEVIHTFTSVYIKSPMQSENKRKYRKIVILFAIRSIADIRNRSVYPCREQCRLYRARHSSCRVPSGVCLGRSSWLMR